MRKFLQIGFTAALTAAAMAALAGCSHQKSADDSVDEHVVRVDKDTGVVTVIDDNRIVKVKTPQEQEAEDRENDELAKPRSMTSVQAPFAGGGLARLTIFWHDDQLQYTFSVAPDSAGFERARRNPQAAFDILLRGPDGSLVKRFSVPAASLEMAKAGEPAGVSKNGSTPCSSDDYRRIISWDLTWRGLDAQ